MADASAASLPQQTSPATSVPGAEELKSSSEVKDDTPKAEKWPFSEPQPIREDLVNNAVNFLSHPKVRGTPIVQRRSFLERKGLSREEIDEAFLRCPDPPTSEGSRNLVSTEGKLVTPAPIQRQAGVQQAVLSPQPQSLQQFTSAPAMVTARSGPNWSHMIMGASLIAAAGAGTGYLFQKVLVPKFRSWLREVLKEEGKPTESRAEVQGKIMKLSPLEETVGAAVAAANAAAAASAEMASASRELLKSQADEWQQLKSLIKSLESHTEELKSTLTIISKNSRDFEGQMVSATQADEHHKGSVKAFQRTSSAAEQVPIRQSIQNSKVLGVGNGSLSNVHSATFNNHVSHAEEEPLWWQRKKIEVETFTPKQQVESTVQISEINSGLDQETGSRGVMGVGAQRGVPLGRQGWVPPPVPQTVMPGAASAIRYQKPAIVDEVRARASAGSEEKAMDPQTSYEQPQMPQVAEAADGTSVDKQIPFSSMQEGADDGMQVAEHGDATSVDKEIPFSLFQGGADGDGMGVPEANGDDSYARTG